MFFEGLGSASVVNGVLRIETFYRNAKGEDVPNGELVIPNNRVIPVAEALQAMIERIRQQNDLQAAAETAAAE